MITLTVASDNEVGSEGEVSDVDSLKSFIDDKTEIQEDGTCYFKFENATKSIDETLAEVSIFCESSEEEGEIDEFKEAEKKNWKVEEGANNSFV